jgi:hypothetical protein
MAAHVADKIGVDTPFYDATAVAALEAVVVPTASMTSRPLTDPAPPVNVASSEQGADPREVAVVHEFGVGRDQVSMAR